MGLAKLVFFSQLILLVLGCSQTICRNDIDKPKASAKVNTTDGVTAIVSDSKKADLADRVIVFKQDGSLQCGMGEAISLEKMQKELGSIKVYSSYNRNDGMMRIQLCGSPTGNCNFYEIDRKSLAKAIAAGFEEWEKGQ